jgi:methyl-accepting chemotaxis protein
MSRSTSNPRAWRKKYLLDPKWQITISLRLAAIALVAGLAHVAAIRWISDIDTNEGLSGRQLGLLAAGISACYILILAGGVLWLAIRFTHAVVGPAMVLERAVSGMAKGDFTGRLELRRGDYLLTLAASLQKLRETMQADRAKHRELTGKLTAALKDRETAAAREAAQALANLFDAGGEERPRKAA